MIPDPVKVRVALFENAYDRRKPKEIELGAILNDIRGSKYEAKIRRARELFAAWKRVCPKLDSKESHEGKAYDAFKRTLPAFCVSGTAESRTLPLEHSGLLQVDLDRLDGTLDDVREKLRADRHVAFGFVSPSGNGLKLGLAIDGIRHAESFEIARQYFRLEYDLDIDPHVKDRLRLCFVSYDPALWTRPDAEPLPMPAHPPESKSHSPEIGGFEAIVLPSGNVSISESAREIFTRIAPKETLFWRGGAIVEMVEQDGVAGLEVLKPEGFRSRVEKLGRLFAWRSDGGGKSVLKPTKMPRDDAAAIMAAVEARELLPPVASVLRCPVLVESSEKEIMILLRGYHHEFGGLLVVAGDEPPYVELSEAVASLNWLVEQFQFQSEGDRSRALAAFITPALRMGGFFNGTVDHVPIDVAEADRSQAGKGYRQNLVCSLYNELGYLVTARNGGVGSTDESFAAALIAGRPFVCLDNLRGRLDSQHLEAFLTCPSFFPARIPHRGEVMVNPKRFLLQITSNGLEATRDLANRGSVCRISKRPNFKYRETLEELQERQPYFLGCVFSVLTEWIARGKPRTNDTRHSFTKWNQTLDWIVQCLFGCVPLMEGHERAQDRVSNPALAFLRSLGLALDTENRLGQPISASDVVEIAEVHGLAIPGNPKDEGASMKQIGRLFRPVFKESDATDVDGFRITRGVSLQSRTEGGPIETKVYTFARV